MLPWENFGEALSRAQTPPIDGSRVAIKEFHGRLGNNFLQLANALLYCQIMNLTHLVMPEGSRDAIPILTLPSEIPVVPDPKANFDHNISLCIDFFGRCVVAKKWQMRAVLMQHLPLYFNEATKKACQAETEHPFDGLTIHLRSGDARESQSKYGVFAPCAFLEKVISDHNFNSVRVITEPDRSHECLRVLENKRGKGEIKILKIQSNTLEEDTCAIMHAKHLAVGSFSTFTQVLELMNDRLKALYWPIPFPMGQESTPCYAMSDDDPTAIATYNYGVVGMTNVNDVTDLPKYFERFPIENITLRERCLEGQELPFRGPRYGTPISIADRR